MSPRHWRLLFPLTLAAAAFAQERLTEFPADFPTATPEEHGLQSAKLDAIWADLAAHRTNIFVVIRNDRIVYERYADGYDRHTPHYTASMAKGVVGGLSLMLAMEDGLIQPDDRAATFIPEWAGVPLKQDITVAQLASHTSGLADANESGVAHRERSGWKGAFWRREAVPNDPFTLARDEADVLFPPGTDQHYSNPGIAMLTYAVTATLRGQPDEDVRSLLQHRIMAPLNIPPEEFKIGYDTTFDVDGLPLVASWGGAEISANASARIGRLLLHQGDWDETHIFSPEIIKQTTRRTGLPNNHGVGWWINEHLDFTREFPTAPRNTFWAMGAQGQCLIIMPAHNMIVIRHGGAPDPASTSEETLGRLMIAPLMQAFTPQSQPPYPPSPVITGVEWAPADTIVRRALGSDNWPVTAGHDGVIYTAYGDGNGFIPYVPEKLSLGLARLAGKPGRNLIAENLRSESGEQLGDGRHGRKASGLLMVDDVLYMLTRNAANSQLAWSHDHGETWTWSDWKFTGSFGFPSFLNFGPDYTDTRDDYVYVYSTDADSAYVRADCLVLARVPKTRIRDRDAYEFYAGRDDQESPQWSANVADRVGVFENPGSVYRSQVTYNPGLGRYLLTTIGRGNDTRYYGGFGVYDAPEPWGPWTTVFFTDAWDVGPGETNSFPPVWMSEDGRTAWLVFSGNDHFSARRATFMVKEK